jgi:hypothetical protein
MCLSWNSRVSNPKDGACHEDHGDVWQMSSMACEKNMETQKQPGHCQNQVAKLREEIKEIKRLLSNAGMKIMELHSCIQEHNSKHE